MQPVIYFQKKNRRARMFILKGFWNGSSCQSLLNQSGPRQQRPFRHSTVPSFGVRGHVRAL
jgi:hypothetical protein